MRLLVFFCFWGACCSLMAQPDLPVLRAHSPVLSIQDGEVIRQQYWTASADIPLDIYEADRLATPKIVAFISDLDTLEFELQPGGMHDFWVILEDGGKCRTRLKSGFRLPADLPPAGRPDTLPFTLTEFNHMIFPARLNGRDSVRLMFHLAAQGLTLIEARTADLPSVKFDQPDSVHSWGGSSTSRTSAGNVLELGPFSWENQQIWENKNSGQYSDGKFGLNYFDDRVLEFDFNQPHLIVHTRLPDTSGFVSYPLKFRQEMVFVPTDIQVGDSLLPHSFLLHSGYGGFLLLNDAFAARHKVGEYWPSTSEQILQDAYGHEIKVKKATVPLLQMGPFAMENVPVGFFEGSLGRQSISLMGGQLMQRFNLMLDMQQARLYLQWRG